MTYMPNFPPIATIPLQAPPLSSLIPITTNTHRIKSCQRDRRVSGGAIALLCEMSQPLSSATESVRQQIKGEIAQAVLKQKTPQDTRGTFYEEDQSGNRAYGGPLLEEKVPRLVKGMGLGEVCGKKIFESCYAASTY
ncbi:hypothetical protein N7471_013454 [Penicillium samsonianum]|uniref:uncharacterized protein n=1 Tax=Penicillium samsonianum TaxID=1882272 RepID=UPI002548584D|nr:uncharacterized protein N7471_013454 [Penicillium samsonianum]KAJ6118834.1 hypothetical protein N7471_013454 [Penicillium samsonianum]